MSSGPANDQVTTREYELMRFVEQGWTNKQIASELGVSYGCVSNNLSEVYSKLGLTKAECEPRITALIKLGFIAVLLAVLQCGPVCADDTGASSQSEAKVNLERIDQDGYVRPYEQFGKDSSAAEPADRIIPSVAGSNPAPSTWCRMWSGAKHCAGFVCVKTKDGAVWCWKFTRRVCEEVGPVANVAGPAVYWLTGGK